MNLVYFTLKFPQFEKLVKITIFLTIRHNFTYGLYGFYNLRLLHT